MVVTFELSSVLAFCGETSGVVVVVVWHLCGCR